MELEILTPERKLFSGKVYGVQLPGIDGSFEVLEKHAPLVSALMAASPVQPGGTRRHAFAKWMCAQVFRCDSARTRADSAYGSGRRAATDLGEAPRLQSR